MKKRYIILLFMIIWRFSNAQQYTNFTTKNGLPSNHVYKIIQDYKGFVWFATNKGLVKYNGSNFKTFTTKDGLPTNDIWDIRVTANKIWFFSKSSSLGYIENNKVYAFGSDINNEVLFPNVINKNGNSIFFSDSKTFYHLENGVWKSNSMFAEQFVEKIDHPNVRYLFLKPELDSLFVMNKNDQQIKSFKIDLYKNVRHRGQVNDSLFFWMYPDKFSVLNLHTLQFNSHYYNEKQLKFPRFSDANNTVQVSGENLVSVYTGNKLSNTKKIPARLKSHFSFIDKNNNLWIATFSNGVYFLPFSKQNTTYSLNSNKSGKIKLVNDTIIVNVFNEGFYKYNASTKKFDPYIIEKDFVFSATYFEELKTSYFVTSRKIFAIHTNKKTIHHKKEVARDLVYYNTALYGNSSFGLNRLNPNNFEIEKSFPQHGIRDLMVFNNKLLIATANGIKEFVKDTIQQINIQEFQHPITSLAKINDTELVICTDGFGAYITNLDSYTPLEKTAFLNVQSAFIHHGDIWLATDQGIWHYVKKEKQYKLQRKYTINDGLSSQMINSVYIDKNQLIASSDNGVSVLSIEHQNEQFVDIYVDAISYNNIKIDSTISYTPNSQLQVNIAAIDFSEDNTLSYEYQLLPKQIKSVKTSSKHLIFTDLQPNDYSLIITSKGKTKTLNFTISPLWYQTTLAKTSFILLILFLIQFVFSTIKKRELAKQKKRLVFQNKMISYELHALRSQMNPHFVFNSLNAIQYYITKNEIDLSEKYLVKFAKLIRMFFDFSREKEVSLTKEIQLLQGYLEMEQMRFGKGFKFRFEVDKPLQIHQTNIPSMLLQPIVENAVNHGIFHNGGKGLVELYFRYISDKQYEVIIKDDGVGVKKSKQIQKQSLKTKTTTKSTQILEERISLLNQSKIWQITYTMTDNVDSGTTVKLTFLNNE